MAKFTDRLGRDWKVEVLVMHLPTLRTEFGIDTKSKDWPIKLSELIGNDDEGFVRLLGILCDEQVKAAGLTPADFVAGFGADTLIAASDAMEEAFTDFSLRSIPAREAAKKKMATLHQRIDQRTAEVLELQADEVIEKAMADLETKLVSKKSVGDLPASSASIPTA